MEGMDAIATYVADTGRTKKYPFREGADIPRVIVEGDTVFTLRVVTYGVDDLEVTRAVPDQPDVAAIDAQQARVRAWNATRTTARGTA